MIKLCKATSEKAIGAGSGNFWPDGDAKVSEHIRPDNDELTLRPSNDGLVGKETNI